MRILIVKLGAVGDCVHTLYALHALRLSFPQAFIGWVVEGKSSAVVVGHPDLDRAYVFQRVAMMDDLRAGRLARAWSWLGPLLHEIREAEFDVALDFQTLFKSGMFAWCSGARTRIGFDKWREGNRLFTNLGVTPGDADKHAAQKYMALIEVVGAQRCFDPPHLPAPAVQERAAIDAFFFEQNLDGRKVAAINPAASWPTKRWPAQKYGEACLRLAERGCVPLVIWGPGEEELAQQVIDLSQGRALKAPATGLLALAHLLSRCALYLGNDSGPMHIAAVMGTPVVALFGPSDPERVGPLVEPSIVLTHEVDCGPCWKHQCADPRCIEQVEVERAVQACLTILERPA